MAARNQFITINTPDTNQNLTYTNGTIKQASLENSIATKLEL